MQNNEQDTNSDSNQEPRNSQHVVEGVPEQSPQKPLGATKKVVIEIIPSDKQRYKTVGDWFYDEEGVLQIRANEYEDPRWSLLIAMHELIESIACTQEGITYQQVDEFDMGAGAELEDPGHDMRAPYHKQHVLATALENRLALHLGVDWAAYDKEVSN